MELLGKTVNPLGMGCWPIGGEMFAGGGPVGYSNANDAESLRTIHAAYDADVTLFDTAVAYGAGHSEKLLGQALADRPDAVLVTKIGVGIDEEKREYTGASFAPDTVMPAIEGSLRRLQRDSIDVVLLHLNDLSPEDAAPGFEVMERAVEAGKIKSYGWSTDFTASASSAADNPNFKAVEHSMNLFFDAPRIQGFLKEKQIPALIRSPLAMGVLSGKYDASSVMSETDIRSTQKDWMSYFKDGRVNAEYLDVLNAVRELLTSDGRSVVQGAIGWLWAKNDLNIPVPGARTVEQIEGIAKALEFGPLSAATMDEIESLVPREDPQTPDRAR